MRYTALLLALGLAFVPPATASLAAPSPEATSALQTSCCRVRATSSHASRARATTYHAPRVRAPSASYHVTGAPRTRVARYHASRRTRAACCKSPSYGAPRIRSTTYHAPRALRTTTIAGSGRDARGRIERSEPAKHAFERSTGYAGGRKGYVVDHIVPLACGGADAPSNMQWQTAAEGKAKDKVERRGCSRSR